MDTSRRHRQTWYTPRETEASTLRNQSALDALKAFLYLSFSSENDGYIITHVLSHKLSWSYLLPQSLANHLINDGYETHNQAGIHVGGKSQPLLITQSRHFGNSVVILFDSKPPRFRQIK